MQVTPEDVKQAKEQIFEARLTQALEQLFPPGERFVTKDLGRYTAKYDTAVGSLRLSWSGDQTFLDENETRLLLAFLFTTLPDAPGGCSLVADPAREV